MLHCKYYVIYNTRQGGVVMVSYKPLMVTLASLEMTKTQLREKAGFSTKTLAKLSKNEPVTLDIIEKICKCLGCRIEQVVDFIN